MIRIISVCLFIVITITSCDSQDADKKVDFTQFDHKETLEISPDRWLDIYYDRDNEGFIFEWNGKIVRKKITIKYNDEGEMLLSLREKNGLLYMIFLNRIDIHRVTYDFYKLSDEGTGFVKIESKDYPKEIATENRIPANFNVGIGGDGNRIDDLKLLRELDVENGHFHHQSTAGIWVCLEKGLQKHEQNDFEAKMEIIKDYKKKYTPIALKNIITKEREKEFYPQAK